MKGEVNDRMLNQDTYEQTCVTVTRAEGGNENLSRRKIFREMDLIFFLIFTLKLIHRPHT